MVDWTGVIAIEGETTGDGRLLDPGSLNWGEGPWALIWDREEGDHSGQVVGSMTRIWRDGNMVRGEGDFSESDDPTARSAILRAKELVAEGAVGVSVRLDAVTVEVRARINPEGAVAGRTVPIHGDPTLQVAATTRPWSAAAARNRIFVWAARDGTFDPWEVARGFLYLDPDSQPDDRKAWGLGIADVVNGDLRIVPRAVEHAMKTLPGMGLPAADESAFKRALCHLAARTETDCAFADEVEVVAGYAHDDILEVTTSGRVRHLAIVDTAAIADARIGLVAVGLPLVAGAAPTTEAAFADPQFGVTGHEDARLVKQQAERPGESVTWGAPLTVTDDGLVFGHACLWGRCHSGFKNKCVIPPKGGDYSRFLHGEAAPGVRTGTLTVGTTHAALQASPKQAMDHYSHTGRAVADVAVGEDSLGLWVSGRLRPGITDRDLADLRGSSLSGDWRPANGKYRLCGLLAVNQPGYLVQRPAIAASDGVITAGPCSCENMYNTEEVEFDLDGLVDPVVEALAAEVAALAKRVDDLVAAQTV